jgi:hypothetical protein
LTWFQFNFFKMIRNSIFAAAWIACTLCIASAAMAQTQPSTPEQQDSTPTYWRLTSESLKLPHQEKMGLVGGSVLIDVANGVGLGVGSYGAVRGERGGFITLGVAGEMRRRISPQWLAHAGLFVGAGGGRGSQTLSGGGLMLRGELGVKYETAGYGHFGLGLSHVRFPSGEIRSTQPYALYEYPFYSLLHAAWGVPAQRENSTTLASRRQAFSLVARSYKIASSAVQDDGAPQHHSMQLMGVEWLSELDEHWFIKLESEGAMGGRSNGYMQILLGAGYRLQLAANTALQAHVAAGPAGGGHVDTGGGLLLDAGLGWQQNLSPQTSLELSVGKVRAPSRSFLANSVALKLNHRFGVPAVGAQPVSTPSLGGFTPMPLRVRFAQQTYTGAAPQWRNSFTDVSVGNLGVQMDYFVSPHIFLTGQGLAAYSGKAGAYMKGLVGLGVQQALLGPWFVQAEGLVGAAGGGGLAVGGGLVGQVNAGAGYRLNPSLSLIASAGRITALRGGDFKARVLGLSMAYEFTGFTRF